MTNIVQVVAEPQLPNQIVVTLARGPGVQQFLHQVQVFTVPGTISVGVGSARFYVPGAITLSNVRASVGTAPTGSSIIIDVNKNGSSVFTTNSKPTIYAGQTLVSTSTPNIKAFTTGDYISVDVDQIGSLNPGQNLTVQIEFTP